MAGTALDAAEVSRRPTWARRSARVLASAAFVLLIVGITYFATLVIYVRFGPDATRATAFIELGDFLSGQGEWYRDARTYGGGALLLALFSILFGVHPLARITLPIAGALFLILHLRGDEIREMLTELARRAGP